MKILNFLAKNFGSYDEITFDFEEGLTLISGPTGAGKSTFQDISFWALFGLTAKGGSVDDVRSWVNADGPTSVELSLLTSQGPIKVVRIRGKQHENDLYWTENNVYEERTIRGKDLRETQKLLEAKIRLSAEDYEISAYFHEFSPTTQFFTTSSKNQRSLLESVANLEWPVKVAERVQEHKKQIKNELLQLEKTLEKQLGKLEQLNASYEDATSRLLRWEDDQTDILSNLKEKSETFDQIKEKSIKQKQNIFDTWEMNKKHKLDSLQKHISEFPQQEHNKICKECGQTNRKAVEAEFQLKTLIREFESNAKTENPYIRQLVESKEQQNLFETLLQTEKQKINPFLSQTEQIIQDVRNTTKSVESNKVNIKIKNTVSAHLETLYAYTFDLRGHLLRSVVKSIEKCANQYLSDFFDAELKITLDIEGSDAVELNIFKSGHQCNFKQLSKGQRGLLNICFSTSVMKASSNRLGLHFDQLFFDESLSGLDADLKIKAFRLFQHLNKLHTSIYVIDHATEFKALFDKQYKVEINGDVSTMALDE